MSWSYSRHVRHRTCRCVLCEEDIGSSCGWGFQGCCECAARSEGDRASHWSASELQCRSGVRGQRMLERIKCNSLALQAPCVTQVSWE